MFILSEFEWRGYNFSCFSFSRYNQNEIFIRDSELEDLLLHTFGFYWHSCMKVAEALRSIHNDEPVAYANETSEGELIENQEIFDNIVNSTGRSD